MAEQNKGKISYTVCIIILVVFIFLSILSGFGLGAVILLVGEIPLLIQVRKDKKGINEEETALREQQADLERIKVDNERKFAEQQTAVIKSQKELEEKRQSLGIAAYEDAEKKAAELLEKTTQECDKIEKKRQVILNAINNLAKERDELEKAVVVLSEEKNLQDFGLYEPKYDFADSSMYKSKLSEIRDKQKAMVKERTAVTGTAQWTVNNSATQGTKMIRDMQKLLLRAFNSECDSLIAGVKFNTFDSAVQRMERSRDAISKCGAILSIAISDQYYQLKYEELCLALEYQQKKQAEKEEQKEIRARMREEAKLQKEIEAARQKIQKEQKHYTNALEQINEQIKAASEDDLQELLDKRNVIESQLSEIDKSIKDIDYREANARAGYVYIISNIGSFGENVYKIGMTRRLDPLERIDELSDASVPFNFDVHAMIFSDDAPALEAALHNAFEDRKVNMVNKRREFFNVSLDEIEEVVKNNFDKTVDFVRLPQAEQYRETMKIKEAKTA